MWKDLTLQQKAEIMKMSVANGVTDINDIQQLYDDSVGHRFDDAGRIITLADLPREYVQKYGHINVVTPKGVRMPLSQAYRDYNQTPINVNDVPGLTDYLIKQDQPDISEQAHIDKVAADRFVHQLGEERDKALIALAAALTGGGALASGLALAPVATIGSTIGGIAGEKAFNAGYEKLTGNNWGQDVERWTNGYIPAEYGEYLNPGTLIGSSLGSLSNKGMQLLTSGIKKASLARVMNNNIDNPSGLFYGNNLLPYTREAYNTSNPFEYKLEPGVLDFRYNGIYPQRISKSKLTRAERLGIPKGERNNVGGIRADNTYGNLRFIRNFGELPAVDEHGMVKLIGNDTNLLGNFTTDLPFRLHKGYSVPPGPNYMVVSPRAFRGKKFLSIDPGDSFLYRGDAVVDPKYVRIISGEPNVLAEASRRGMRTTTSDELQRLYKIGADVTKKEYDLGLNGAPRPFQNADVAADNLKWYGHLESYPENGVVTPYRGEVDRIISETIGRPTREDYRTLEKMTGLDAHLAPNFNENLIVHSTDKLASPTTFKHVYYDVTPPIEGKVMEDMGLYAHPYDSFSNYLTIRSWLGKNNVKPLQSLGGHLFDKGGSKNKRKSTRGTNYHTNEAQAFVDELVAAGVRPVDAQAVAGNVFVESRFNHEAANNINGGHWGLVQNDANIKRHIVKYYGDYSRNSQMQFLKDGLTGQIRGAKNARWLQQRFDDYRRHSAGVKDASVAAKYFHDDYERSRNEMVADRMKAASFYQTGIATNPTIAAFNRVYGNQSMSVPDIDYEALYEPSKVYGLDWSNRPQQEEEQIIQRPTEPIMSVMEREEPPQEQPAVEQDNFVQLPSFRLSSLQSQPIAAQQRHALVTPVMQAAAQEAPSEVQSILSSPYIIFGRDLG